MMSPGFGLVEDYASDRVRDFLTPQTFEERAYVIFALLWILIAALFSNSEFRLLCFGATILFYAFNCFRSMLRDSNFDSFFSSGLKLFVIYLCIHFLNLHPSTNILPTEWSVTYDFVEQAIIMAIIIGSIVIRGLILKFESRSWKEYLNFISAVIRATWYASVIFVFLVKLDLMPLIAFERLYDQPFEELVFLITTVLFIISGVGIGYRTDITNFAEQIFFSALTPYEKVRENLLVSTIVAIVFIALSWLNHELWTNIIIGAVIVVVILYLGDTKAKKEKRQEYLKKQLSGFSPLSMLGEEGKKFTDKISNIQFVKPNEEQEVHIFTEDTPILSSAETQFTVEKGTIAVPIKNDEETEAFVLIGKGNSTSKMEGSDEIKTTTVEGEIPIMLRPDDWRTLQNKTEKKKIRNLDLATLPVPIVDLEDLSSKVERGIAKISQWKGPKNLMGKARSLIQGGKYGVQETKDFTRIRFPGVQIIEAGDLDLVNVMGIRIVDSGADSMVNIWGIVQILEYKGYDFIQLPGIRIIDGPNGELINIFGFTFGEGNTAELEEFARNIQTHKQNLKNKITSQLLPIIQEEPRLLLAEGSDGTAVEILMGDTDSFVSETVLAIHPSEDAFAGLDKGFEGLVEKVSKLEKLEKLEKLSLIGGKQYRRKEISKAEKHRRKEISKAEKHRRREIRKAGRHEKKEKFSVLPRTETTQYTDLVYDPETKAYRPESEKQILPEERITPKEVSKEQCETILEEIKLLERDEIATVEEISRELNILEEVVSLAFDKLQDDGKISEIGVYSRIKRRFKRI